MLLTYADAGAEVIEYLVSMCCLRMREQKHVIECLIECLSRVLIKYFIDAKISLEKNLRTDNIIFLDRKVNFIIF